MTIYQQFAKIAEEAIQKAGKVPCSQHDYRGGLKQIIDEFEIALDAAKGCGDDDEE